MSEEEYFSGFSDEKQQIYEEKIVEQFGADDAKYKQSKLRWGSYSQQQKDALLTESDNILKGLVALIGSGVDHPKVQALIKRQHEYVNNFWDCDLAAFGHQGDFYITNPDFVKTYRDAHPDMPEFIHSAIQHYVAAG